ncbi:hypothetical protein CKY28_13115 [Sphingomonas lenta]|uniref:Uncharacterized protein n=1 Tax=Sphingomonas lenta TaxID=1141887 RepID=A0A2A2SCL7_9SPHN|nr:hypothetical protein CKY28_13115 [Sphingomonas lenta]
MALLYFTYPRSVRMSEAQSDGGFADRLAVALRDAFEASNSEAVLFSEFIESVTLDGQFDFHDIARLRTQ